MVIYFRREVVYSLYQENNPVNIHIWLLASFGLSQKLEEKSTNVVNGIPGIGLKECFKSGKSAGGGKVVKSLEVYFEVD